MVASPVWNRGIRSPWVALSKITRPIKLRAAVPESREERSASSRRFSGRVEMMIRIASRSTTGGSTSSSSASPPRWTAAGSPVARAVRGAVSPTPDRVGLPVRGPSSPGSADGPGDGRSPGKPSRRKRSIVPPPRAARPSPSSRQPGVNQDCHVLFVLLLEFLDHQFAALRRGPPVDPPRAIPGR